jgi:hypothetical protein
MGIGALLGVWVGFKHQPHLTCSHHIDAAKGLNHCTTHVIWGLVLHWGVALGGGVLIGAFVGALIAVMIRPRAGLA